MSNDAKPHYTGHRQRLRQRFLNSGANALADYELLELILFSSHPRGDVKPLAKRLLSSFGTFAKVVRAEPKELLAIEEMGEAAVAAIKTVEAALEKILRDEVKERPVLQTWKSLLDYCKVAMAHKKIEEFRVLFLNNKNELLRDEVQQHGTVDHTPVYPREVVKRALELGASAIILVHNHPSGDLTPSRADIDITKQIIKAADALGVSVHDHLIISDKGHFSFKSNHLI